MNRYRLTRKYQKPASITELILPRSSRAVCEAVHRQDLRPALEFNHVHYDASNDAAYGA
jgi:hypothetical protein